MLDDEVVGAQLLAEPRERHDLVRVTRVEHHLHADGHVQAVALLDLDHVADVLAHAVEPVLLHAHDLGVALALAGGDVDAQVGKVRQHFLELALVQDKPVRAHGHGDAELAAAAHCVHEHRRDRALAVGDEADALHADLGAVLEELEDHLAVDDLAVVLLQHRVAVVAAVVAGARERHVDGDGRDALAALPGADAVLVPGDLRPIQDQVDVVRHSAHRFYSLRSTFLSFTGSRYTWRVSSIPAFRDRSRRLRAKGTPSAGIVPSN